MRRLQGLLFVCGVGALSYCGFVLADAWMFQREESRQLDQLMVSEPKVEGGAMVATGGLIGRVEIERLGISVMIVEGVGSKVLRRAVGHIPGTALPGQPGNAAISAHRDTFFRPLRNIRQDDVISVSTPGGEYRYRVVSIRIVAPDNVSVLEPSVNEVLTLVTCYPFYFVGNAPDRFVVRAERLGKAT